MTKHKISETFRKLKYKIYYNIKNTIRKQLNLNNNSHKINKHNKAGVYKLTCSDCNILYIGQFMEIILHRIQRTYKIINHPYSKSNFAEHIISTGCKYTNISTNPQIGLLQKNTKVQN